MIRLNIKNNCVSCFISLTCVVLQFPLFSQLNVKIGYNASFPSFAQTNQLLEAYSVPDQEITDPFKTLSFMHGIQLGARYRMGNVGILAGWERVARNRSALSFKSQGEVFTTRTYDFSLSGFHFGFENYFGRFGYSTSLHAMNYNISRQVSSNNLQLVSDTNWNLRMSLIWILQESDLVSVSIQPYYQFNLSDYNIAPFASDIGSSSTSSGESIKTFGISFVFYNGRQ